MAIFDKFLKKDEAPEIITEEKQKQIVKECGLSHIAFIMDGNGRWATSKGLPREAGHSKGAAAFKHIVRRCGDIGIDTVTVYALSTENLKMRPEAEIKALMRILDSYIDEAETDREKNNTRFVFIGDIDGLGEEMSEKCRHLAEITKDCATTLNLALNYGGRAEIARAASIHAAKGKTEIGEDDLSREMYTNESPDPDLIVRTAGEERLSNFLLWQAAYSEFYFTDTLWPDFDDDALALAVEAFGKRRRKYGAVK